MLDLFRRKKGALKWVLWLVIIGLGAGMALLFVQTPTGLVGTFSNQEVAIVAGKPITLMEFRRRWESVYDGYRQRSPSANLDPEQLKQMGLVQQVINELVSEYVVEYVAENIGIQVTPEEVADYITSSPSFQENGQFVGVEIYERMLQSINYSTVDYEEAVRQGLIRDKLIRILSAGMDSSAEEVRQEFLDRNQELKIRYIAVNPEEEIQPDVGEEDLQIYFQERQENYRTEEQRKIKYIAILAERDSVTLTEQQIRERMASVSEKDEVEASHILISSITPDAESKAQDILQQLKDGADFAELAKEHSDDPGSAPNGGHMGFFKRGLMVPSFENAAFSLEPGEISDLVATEYGLHIIKVTDVKLIDNRVEAEAQLKKEEAESLAQSLATRILYEARNNSDLETAAREYQIEALESQFWKLEDTLVLPFQFKQTQESDEPQDTPATTLLILQNDFNRQIFTLQQNQLIEPFLTAQSYVVAELTDIQPSQLSEFETVRDEVTEDFKITRADETARERAFAFSQAAREKLDFEGVAQSQNLQVVTSDLFKRDTSINDDLGYATEIIERVFLMQEDQTSPVVEAAGKYVVFQVADKGAVDEGKFEEERDALLEELSQNKKQQFFSDYLQNIIEQLETEDRIQINRELVDSIIG
ncbi:MAG: SurA N-terminal domain-containing protein [Acidobacteriota bacterium]|nr:SurA N-terminal domain-containing protein [Acidobacteriota bacterium]